jgi:hypothetical protein
MSFPTTAKDIAVSPSSYMLSALLDGSSGWQPATLDLNRIIGIDGRAYHYLSYSSASRILPQKLFFEP